MMLEFRRRKVAATLCGGALTVMTPAAFGADCNTLGLPNPIYGAGGSAETATIAKVAQYYAGLLDHPITIFWADPGACTGYQQYLNNSLTNTAVKFWNADGVQSTCNATALPVDFAHMGNDHGFCVTGGATVPSEWPAGFGTVLAPVQTLNIIVDRDSSQKSISQEALYYILGFGAGATDKSVQPWTNPAHVVTRSPTSFVSQFLTQGVFKNTLVPLFDDPGKNGAGDVAGGYNGRLGFRAKDQDEVVAKVVEFGGSSPETPIGYVSGSAADKARASTKTLAYQHEGQACGYWPDSSDATFDKINVRTGKYHFWTPGHFFARVDDGSTAADIDRLVNPDVEKFFRDFVGSDDLEVLNRVIDAGDVPLCAMRVNREGLDGAISSYVSPDPTCGCYFESRVAGSAQCDECRDGHDEDCTEEDAVCRRGYCEAY